MFLVAKVFSVPEKNKTFVAAKGESSLLTMLGGLLVYMLKNVYPFEIRVVSIQA